MYIEHIGQRSVVNLTYIAALCTVEAIKLYNNIRATPNTRSMPMMNAQLDPISVFPFRVVNHKRLNKYYVIEIQL